MWRFLALCGFVQVACQGFLVREACVGVLMGGAVFLLSPFKDLGCFSGCLISSGGFQKLFCGIYSTFKCSFDEFVGEKVFSPSYSSAILAPSPFSFFERKICSILGASKMGEGSCFVAQLCPTLVTPWTVACQASLSMRFPRQEYWSG